MKRKHLRGNFFFNIFRYIQGQDRDLVTFLSQRTAQRTSVIYVHMMTFTVREGAKLEKSTSKKKTGILKRAW